MNTIRLQRLDKILSDYNVDGEIYRCDIKNYFGWDLPKDKIEELHKLFMDIRSQRD